MYLIYVDFDDYNYKKVVNYNGLKEELYLKLEEHINNNVDMGNISIDIVREVMSTLKDFMFSDYVDDKKIISLLKEFGYNVINLYDLQAKLSILNELVFRVEKNFEFEKATEITSINKVIDLIENIKIKVEE